MIQPHIEALRQNVTVTLVKRDIAGNPAWSKLYRYRIPVLSCDDRVILEGRPGREDVAVAFVALGG